ncbi:MAG: adenylate/guanylate cyclase domain-containing protein [Thermoanaerobaculia bacterium]
MDEPTLPASNAPDATGATGEAASAADAKAALSKIRHDLRTPVNQIVGYGEMLQEEAQERSLDTMADDLGKIVSAARRMLELLEKAFANPDANAAMSRSATGPAEGAPAHDLSTGVPTFVDRDESHAAPVVTGDKDWRLLVVDDNEMNRDMLARRLRQTGYSADTAEDGASALEIIEHEKYDLVLLDVMMPGINGIDVLKIVRQKHGRADLPVIMATAMDESHMIVEALELGANDYVTKPLDFPVVLARLSTQLQLKKAQDDLAIRNEFIRRTFGRYLSDDIVASLLETPDGLTLGGEKREVTIMMSDVRGFTSLSERLPPESVVRMLNNYLGVMAKIILRYHGTIDEFIGDAILAIFGAPDLRDDDAARCIACAIEMQLAMEQVNEFNDREGFPRLEMGIAINTGDVVVGNIGSEDRAKYGVVGSPVNLTARIESYSIGGQILAAETTVVKLGDLVKTASCIEVNAKGLAVPMKAYDIRGIAGQWGLELPERVENFVDLPEPVVVRFAVLEGKHVGDMDIPGTFKSLSMAGAVLVAEVATPPLTNLKLRVIGLSGGEIPSDLYGKVIGVDERGAILTFTSTPPDVGGFFKAVLDKIPAGH